MNAKLFIVLLFVLGTMAGCGHRQSPGLELFKYSAIQLPTPSSVSLINNSSDQSQPEEVVLTKADVISLMRVLRLAVDKSLKLERMEQEDAEKVPLRLELKYDQPATFELVVDEKLISFETKLCFVDVEENRLVILSEEGNQTLSPLQFSDDFRQFIRQYDRDKGFPLPPAKMDQNIEQLPLARPGKSGVELLPPAQGNKGIH